MGAGARGVEAAPDAREVRAFYDRFGRTQDRQAFYEDAAVEVLIARAVLDRAEHVLEIGCGTGRLGARLLSEVLPPRARYVGTDLSRTMVGLAAERLSPFPGRASVCQVDGTCRMGFADHTFDRVLSTYVVDLLSPAGTQVLLGEVTRVLRPGGLLGLVGLTPGQGWLDSAVSNLWSAVYRLRPMLVGGCRPRVVGPAVAAVGLRLLHHQVVSAWAISSEVIVAAAPAATA